MMGALAIFLAKSILVSGVLMVWYWLGLRRTRLHQYNRAYLLFTLYASLQLPLLHFSWFTIDVPQAAVVGDNTPVIVQVVTGEAAWKLLPMAEHAVRPDTGQLLVWSMGLVSLLLLVRLIVNIAGVVSMVRKYPRTTLGNSTIVHTDIRSAPFSFFRYLFWNDAVSMDSAAGQLMLRHEQVHTTQVHSLDKIVCQLLTCIFWMNPFYWIARKELEMTHEFIADGAAVAPGDGRALAAMLLERHGGSALLRPEHSFYSSPIKRRLTMVNKTKRTSHAWLRRLAVVPCVAGALMAFSFAPGSKHVPVSAQKKIVMVVDAGHGGKDAGATYGSLQEKNITLQVAQRLRELAPQHNIEVYLTRSTDEYVILNDRVAYTNTKAPDVFLSVHVADEKNAGKGNELSLGVVLNAGGTGQSRAMEIGRQIYTNALAVKGVRKSDKWYREQGILVLRNSKVPALMIDLGDIKSPAQLSLLANSEWRDELCHAILNGVAGAVKQ